VKSFTSKARLVGLLYLLTGSVVFLGSHSYGVIVAQILWGLWLAPFGMLIFRLPPILGILLMSSSVSYVASSITVLLFPNPHVVAEYMIGAAGFGELAIILWLLISVRHSSTVSRSGIAKGRFAQG
jgi:hypothetical protein